MKENIKYIDKGTVNVDQDRPILTRMHIPNTDRIHSIRNAKCTKLKSGVFYNDFFPL